MLALSHTVQYFRTLSRPLSFTQIVISGLLAGQSTLVTHAQRPDLTLDGMLCFEILQFFLPPSNAVVPPVEPPFHGDRGALTRTSQWSRLPGM